MIVDAHTHVTADGKWFHTSHDASVGNLLRQMDIAGIERAVLLPISGVTSNQFVSDCVREYKGRFIGFGALSVKSWKDDTEQIVQLGLDGIKLHPRIQGETLRAWLEAGILHKIADMGLPLMVCGWPQSKTDQVAIADIGPLEVDRIAKILPSLKIIIAHLSGHFFWDAFFCARSNDNVFLDCSYFFEFMRGTSLEQDFWKVIKKIDQKIIFGSDFPEIDIVDYVSYFGSQLEKTAADRHRILSRNILQLVK